MKLKRSVYDVLQYLSTIDEIFVYRGDNIFSMKDISGSSFTEVEIPNFYNEQIIIRSLPKFLRLFTFAKPGRNDPTDPESIQDWTFEENVNPRNNRLEQQMLIKEQHHVIKMVQGDNKFLEYHKRKMRFDDIKLDNSIRFQMTRAMYKQIQADCSLLNLDLITFSSIDEHRIKIYLSKKDTTNNYDDSVTEIECDHKHFSTKISIMLNTFSLIDATDHEVEFGFYYPTPDNVVNIVKIKSFYHSDLVVKRAIIGIKGDY